MLENYLPIIVFIFLGIAFGVGLTVVGYLLGPSDPSDEKNSQFECGFPAFDDSRMHFNIRYYLVAILFVLFDLEVAFFHSKINPTTRSSKNIDIEIKPNHPRSA